MENITKLALLLFLISLILLAYQLPATYRAYNKLTGSVEGTIMEKTIPHESTWKYVLFLPSNFDASKSYPLIIGLHGSGGSARDYAVLWSDEANKYGFIVACPQSNDSEAWWPSVANYDVLAIINETRENYNITDVFLTGASAGAKITYELALWNPSTFKGIAPVSSSFGTYVPNELDLRNAKGQNFYILHGREDTVIPLENALYVNYTLNEYGANVIFRVLENHGHEYPIEENENIAKWFLSLESNSTS